MTIHSTTICAVKKDGTVAIAGDGQASAQEAGIVMKGNCRKVRRLYDGSIIVGFAGSTADAITLSELFEGKLKQYNGDITRSAVELAKDWRTDKMMKNLNALMIASDGDKIFTLSGAGDVFEAEYDVAGIGSGGAYALAAARAYLDAGVSMSAEEIARKSVDIAADICIYTNHNIIAEVQDGRI